MSRTSLVTVALGTVLMLAGCSDDDTAEPPLGPAALPANLCDAVPTSTIERWALEEVAHETTDRGEITSATCEMTGTHAGRPVELRLSLESYAAADGAAARADVGRRLEEECASLEARAEGSFSDDDRACTDEVRDDERRDTTVEGIGRSIPVHGLATVRMAHRGDGWQLVPAEVVGLVGHLTTSSAGDLAG